ncbi:GNAT family N-acetyltransferase [Abyssisolibacter fermentans]|uniref:GNAT family N-acetyltransferase n=1 Tax=Abyssisolibacter fermentans TaxID=1766203 RepID=UPI0008372CC0|nr:GNAT family N-acetyltransferase [Abyssisolibacter fermentans]
MNDEAVIRAMKESDLDEALKLWRISFNVGFSTNFDTKEILIKYLNRNPGLSSVACTKEGKLIGALMCGHDGRRGSIYHTAVYSEFRNKGIGRRMEQRSLEELKKAGITTGFLFINVNNPGSKEFWNSIGWTVISNIKYLYKEF